MKLGAPAVLRGHGHAATTCRRRRGGDVVEGGAMRTVGELS